MTLHTYPISAFIENRVNKMIKNHQVEFASVGWLMMVLYGQSQLDWAFASLTQLICFTLIDFLRRIRPVYSFNFDYRSTESKE